MSDELVVSTPQDGDTSLDAGSVAATPQTAAPTVATPQSPAAGQPPDDRSGWVPPYRLREAREAATREAAQRYEGQMGQVKAELDRYRSQVQALVGVNPPQNTEADTIRNQFFQLFLLR